MAEMGESSKRMEEKESPEDIKKKKKQLIGMALGVGTWAAGVASSAGYCVYHHIRKKKKQQNGAPVTTIVETEKVVLSDEKLA